MKHLIILSTVGFFILNVGTEKPNTKQASYKTFEVVTHNSMLDCYTAGPRPCGSACSYVNMVHASNIGSAIIINWRKEWIEAIAVEIHYIQRDASGTVISAGRWSEATPNNGQYTIMLDQSANDTYFDLFVSSTNCDDQSDWFYNLHYHFD